MGPGAGGVVEIDWRSVPSASARAAVNCAQVRYLSPGFFAKCLGNDPVRAAKAWLVVGQGGGPVLEVRPEQRGRVLPDERRDTGQAFVRDAAERVQVGARIEPFPPDLFGRVGGHRADEVQ
jgi:hypothetical protein